MREVHKQCVSSVTHNVLRVMRVLYISYMCLYFNYKLKIQKASLPYAVIQEGMF